MSLAGTDEVEESMAFEAKFDAPFAVDSIQERFPGGGDIGQDVCLIATCSSTNPVE